MIALRNEHPVLGRGDLTMLQPRQPQGPRVRPDLGQDENVLVVANLSRHPQFVELDLAGHAGTTPVEIIGRSRFPTITERPYGLSLGPHMFLWFQLEAPTVERPSRPRLVCPDAWTRVTDDRRTLARALAAFASERRWFRSKARTRRHARIGDVVELPGTRSRSLLVTLDIEYTDGEPETYVVPLGFADGESASELEHRAPHTIVAELEVTGAEPHRGVLYDALATAEAAQSLLALARRGGTLDGEVGRIVATSAPELQAGAEPSARAIDLEQTNSTVPLGDRFIIKVFRQLEHGINAELEVGTYLTGFDRPVPVPPVLGSVSYLAEGDEPATVAVVHRQIPNHGTAWQLFAGQLDQMFEHALVTGGDAPALPGAHVFDLAGAEPPPSLVERAGHHLRHARVLGHRTGEVHAALAAGTTPAFAGEKFSVMYQQSLYQGARGQLARTFEALGRQQGRCPKPPPPRPGPRSPPTARSRTACARSRPARSTRSASATTATSTSARSSTPATTSSSSTSRASRPGRCASGATSGARCATSPACCARSATPPSRRCAPARPGRPTGTGSGPGARPGPPGSARPTWPATSRSPATSCPTIRRSAACSSTSS